MPKRIKLPKIPEPPRIYYEVPKIKFRDLSTPLRIAAFMGLFEFVLLMVWLVFVLMVAIYLIISSI